MLTVSFKEGAVYNTEKVNTRVILETSFSKEIRILLATGQIMKEHKAPYPIIVHLLEGAIEFGVGDELFHLHVGDIITLAAHVPHNLKAIENSMVRLTLSKLDDAERIEKVVKN